MYELICYDSDGNAIREFTQWDIGSTIRIKGNFDRLPTVHFFNEKGEKAYDMPPERSVDGIIVEVPNILLIQKYLKQMTPRRQLYLDIYFLK